jgi:hypothetical protein
MEESSGLDVAMCNTSLLLGVLGFLDDGLELSLESIGVGRHGDCK